MGKSIDKREITGLHAEEQDDQHALDPGAGIVLDPQTLDTISAGADGPSADAAAVGLQQAQDASKRRATDAYRDAHPYVHPDDVEKVIANTRTLIGFQG